jgi:hypothetical protein
MFKKKFMQILQALNFVDKAKKNELTDEEWLQIEAEFKKKYGKSMSELQAESNQAEELRHERDAALAVINNSTETDDDDDDDSDDDDDDNSDGDGEGAPATQSLQTGVTGLATALRKEKKRTANLRKKVNTMATQAMPDVPVDIVKPKLSVHGGRTTATHLFGIEHDMFSLKNRWNRIANNPNEGKLSDPSKDEFQAFQSETVKFGSSLANRYRYLKNNHLLDVEKLNSGFTNDFSQLENAGLGDQYVILRQDALIARILQIPTVYDLFPRRYGIQDRELMTTAYFSELSQAWQEGEVYKGSMELQPEMGYVDDAMFKTKFGPMKEIERMYIGYLNTDGSDPIKWSMIEWQLLNMYKILVNEQNKRVIRGCYVKPETGVAGSYLNAGTGLIYTLIRYKHENKLLPHSDAAYNDYSETTMLDAVTAFIDDVKENPDEDFTLENKFLYLNKRHVDWWKRCIRQQFGKDTDFSGPDSYLHVVPDSDVRIKWVPNMGSMKWMFIQEPGNLQALEYVAGEMLGVDFEKQMEMVRVWSTWKEGFSAFIVGKQFNTLAELIANNRSQQEVFMNHPVIVLAPDATTANANDNFWFLTGVNTDNTSITDISNAKKGVVYLIEIGDEAYPSKIAKSGKFADITAAWTPVKKGDYIMVTLKSNGNYLELERCVSGVRTINIIAQPNILGKGGR